jgi:hypothetical protein
VGGYGGASAAGGQAGALTHPSAVRSPIGDQEVRHRQDPLQRLLHHPDVLDDTATRLLAKRFEATNPAQARRDIADVHASLLAGVAHKNVTRRTKQNAVYLSRANWMSQRSVPRGHLDVSHLGQPRVPCPVGGVRADGFRDPLVAHLRAGLPASSRALDE